MGNASRPAQKVMRAATRRDQNRGFVLIIIVGMLAVLVVLGLSFAEQGRIDLLGASNSRDYGAVEGLAESGFQVALRALKEDRNVTSRANATLGWNPVAANGGVGFTSRWGYNPYTDLDTTGGGVRTTTLQPGLGGDDFNIDEVSGTNYGPAPNHDIVGSAANKRNFLDTWQMLLWNEEDKAGGGTKAYGFGMLFEFDKAAEPVPPTVSQRLAADPRVLLDSWQLQPLARVKKFRFKSGSSYGMVQISISPRDGGYNLNDVFERGTVTEYPGMFETKTAGSPDYMGHGMAPTDVRIPRASPDRRTLEYLLGRPPEVATRNLHQPHWSYPTSRETKYTVGLSGNSRFDDGVYNFDRICDPWGRSTTVQATGSAAGEFRYAGGSTDTRHKLPAYSRGRLQNLFPGEPTVFYNAGIDYSWRYNMERPRYVMWSVPMGMSLRWEATLGWLVQRQEYFWWPTGLRKADPRLYSGSGTLGTELLGWQFMGFGFDHFNDKRAGVGANDSVNGDIYYDPANDNGTERSWVSYIGAGAYGHPKVKSFQRHFIKAAANGRFWTDLMAAWYFGGAPGYTNYLGSYGGSYSYNNWAHLGSSYDSLGIGTHWMPPTMHVWLPGKFNNGALATTDIERGLKSDPGNMPPAKPAATFVYPMRKWNDDLGLGNAHFTFTDVRIGVRAYGLQENWGAYNATPASATAANAKWYDAINVNTTNYQVVYGLLHPEKIPSMLNRTVVAPHLHWKARHLDVELRMMNPGQGYDPVRNFWMPVEMTLEDPASPWDPVGNPWKAVRMSLTDRSGLATNPWHPVDNPWNITLVTPGDPYQPDPTVAGFNPVAYDNAFDGDTDFETAPYMPSLHDWFVDRTAPFNATANAIPVAHILYDRDQPYNATTNPYIMVPIQVGDWATFVAGFTDHVTGAGTQDYNQLTMHEPRIADKDDPTQIPPNTGWHGYRFEPRWYNLRTIRDEDFTPGSGLNAINPIPANSSNPAVAAAAKTALTDARTPEFGRYTYHRHFDPDRPSVIWPKMDFLTEQPAASTNVYGDTIAGSGGIQDDVFTDGHYDQSLYHWGRWDLYRKHALASDALSRSRIAARFDHRSNYVDWNAQRYYPLPTGTEIPPLKPNSNDYGGALSTPEGMTPVLLDAGDADWAGRPADTASGAGYRDKPEPVPHPIHGLPNPDYMLAYPGSSSNYFWGDQFRRYFPVRAEEPDGAAAGSTRVPKAPKNDLKKVDEDQTTPLNPHLAAPKGREETEHLFVPRMSRDDGWRVTRVGRKYQEIIADELMDYTINPWWPNPVKQFESDGFAYEVAVPLSKRPNDLAVDLAAGASDPAMPYLLRSEAHHHGALRTISGADSPVWRSYYDAAEGGVGAGVLQSSVPDFYANYNRYRVRANHLYARNRAAISARDRIWGEPYRDVPDVATGAGANQVMIRGVYPSMFQYWGQNKIRNANSLKNLWSDAILDFPQNTLEDQLGCEWRSFTGAVAPMKEFQMRGAPARNHPFKNWADFVAFLGHLVYRSPLPVDTGAAPLAVRDPVLGVNAWDVCHKNAANVDPKNRSGANGGFFDGSRVANGANLGPAAGTPYGSVALADSLVGFRPSANPWNTSIVAIDGHWPISANYGAMPESIADTGDSIYFPGVVGAYLYPQKPSAPTNSFSTTSDAEWMRRIDELRGRDQAGIRVEHHYISEKAANDVLVSLSNGRIGAIDFDGDGYVTMTRTLDINDGDHHNVATAKAEPQSNYLGSEGAMYWQRPRTFPGHPPVAGNHGTVKYFEPKSDNADFWDEENINYGIVKKPTAGAWLAVPNDQIILDSVTTPIKFRSNTFRVTVVVELTDAQYRDVYSVRRFSRVYSRVPEAPTGTQVHGQYSGQFILHGTRALTGSVDPRRNWLGASIGE